MVMYGEKFYDHHLRAVNIFIRVMCLTWAKLFWLIIMILKACQNIMISFCFRKLKYRIAIYESYIFVVHCVEFCIDTG